MPGVVAGAFLGAFPWAAFPLTTELTHIAREREEPSASALTRSAWLATLLVGDALSGLVLPP